MRNRGLSELAHLMLCDAIDLLPPNLTIPAYYRWRTGRWPKSPPRGFTEKVYASKLKPPSPRMVRLSDKISAKEAVEEELGAGWVVPTLFKGEQLPPVDKRNWQLPFVIKASHGSSWNIFVREEPDWPAIERRLARWLSRRAYRFRGETHYRQLQPRVIIEPLLGGTEPPADYKIFLFGGRAEFVQVDTGRYTDHRRTFYDRDWQRLPFSCTYSCAEDLIPAPQSLNQMLQAAEKLAAGFPFLRVDFYDVAGHAYFGEATFFPGAGAEPFSPAEYEKSIGDMWPDQWQVTSSQKHLP